MFNHFMHFVVRNVQSKRLYTLHRRKRNVLESFSRQHRYWNSCISHRMTASKSEPSWWVLNGSWS